MIEPRIIHRAEHSISRSQLDPDALKVLYRLHRHGHIAYLVGGGVRDLLLGRVPKDFDVVTDAHPGEVKKLFRNSWIVGRRFRLVHVVFGSHRNVIEVSTFRAKAETELPPTAASKPAVSSPGEGPGSKSQKAPDRGLLVTWENTFGTPEEDARRRDLSINGLFYDIATYSIIDYVGGLEDLENRLIRTIGEPDIRFQEDPVRMMRAVKFAARLDCRIEDATWDALCRQAAGITLSAVPRVLEEIYRLLESGQATISFGLLHKAGLLEQLIPELKSAASSSQGLFWPMLRELDRMVAGGNELVSRPVHMAVLLSGLVRDELDDSAHGGESLADVVQGVVRPISQRLRMTRADTARLVQMLVAQRRLLRPRGRRFSMATFVRRGYFPGSFQIMRIHAAAAGGMEEAVRRWEERIDAVKNQRNLPAEEPDEGAPSRRRRRRRRRKGPAS